MFFIIANIKLLSLNNMSLKEILRSVGLLIIIGMQVYYIYNNHPELYVKNYHILIIISAFVAAYLVVKYFSKKIDRITKSNTIISIN